KLVYGWQTLENSIFAAFVGAATFLVYVAIFPLLQKLYKRVILPGSSSRGKKVVKDDEERSPLISDNRSGQHQHQHQQQLQQQQDESSAVDPWDGNRRDIRFMIFGGVLYAIGHWIMVQYPGNKPKVIYTAAAIHALSSVERASFMSLLTSFVPVHQTGMALGGICVLDAIGDALSSLLYGWVFSRTSATMPSAVYLISSVLSLIAVVLTLVVARTFRQ
ncbi:hypothetical protein BG004_003623, partial [Podila humilis]